MCILFYSICIQRARTWALRFHALSACGGGRPEANLSAAWQLLCITTVHRRNTHAHATHMLHEHNRTAAESQPLQMAWHEAAHNQSVPAARPTPSLLWQPHRHSHTNKSAAMLQAQHTRCCNATIPRGIAPVPGAELPSATLSTLSKNTHHPAQTVLLHPPVCVRLSDCKHVLHHTVPNCTVQHPSASKWQAPRRAGTLQLLTACTSAACSAALSYTEAVWVAVATLHPAQEHSTGNQHLQANSPAATCPCRRPVSAANTPQLLRGCGNSTLNIHMPHNICSASWQHSINTTHSSAAQPPATAGRTSTGKHQPAAAALAVAY